jgi:hypothetical protein
MQKRICMIKTPDDWSPNYPNNEVELKVYMLRRKPLTYRVAVWGMDDTGMDKDFICPNPKDAIKLYEKIKKKGSVSKAELLELGVNYF